MAITSVRSRGQVTIPKPVRQQLGIRQGSLIEFSLVGDHVELRVQISRRSTGQRVWHADQPQACCVSGFRPRQPAEAMIGLDTNVLARYT